MSIIEPSMRYLARLMGVLIKHDHITVTNLAMLSRMNHQRCGELLTRLEKAGYVRISVVKDRKYFHLTDRGKDTARSLTEVLTKLSVLDPELGVQNVRT